MISVNPNEDYPNAKKVIFKTNDIDNITREYIGTLQNNAFIHSNNIFKIVAKKENNYCDKTLNIKVIEYKILE